MPIRLRDRLRYRLIDRVVARPGRLMALLALACVVLVVLVTAMSLLLTPEESGHTLLGAAWHSLTMLLDPGTIGDERGSHTFLLLMLVVTVGGILIISTLIGVLGAALNEKLATLRRGRTRVVSAGQAVVLGWSDEIHTILAELSYAGDRSVVILGDLSKQEMEEAVRARHGNRIQAVCRQGDPTQAEDLELVPLDNAGAIIVPAPLGEDPDIRVLMTLLALNHRDWPDQDERPPLAAVISSAANVRAARLALQGWPPRLANLVEAEDVTARLLVQSRRYPGLSVACGELLSFAGNEIRLPERDNRAAAFVGATTYGEALLGFETAALIGLRHADGTLDINPPQSMPIGGDDTAVVIARGAGPADIRLLPPNRRAAVDDTAIRDHDTPWLPRVERTLILGRNSRIERLIDVLDGYSAAGSRVDVVGPGYDPGEVYPTSNLTVAVHAQDPTEPGVLVAAEPDDPVDFDLTGYHVVMVLADDESERHADARALVTLLHLREIKDRTHAGFQIICELNDDANRRLARTIRADDLVVGQKVVSGAVVQYAKNPDRRELTEIVDELFDAHGADMFFEPAEDYVTPGVPVTFATVVQSAGRRGETAIGFRVAADRLSDERNYGVFLNPAKSARRSYQPGDQIIVIARRLVTRATADEEPVTNDLVETG